MSQRILFEIESATIVDERNESQFAKLVIDTFASGNNKHNLIVSEETLIKAAHTIYQKPLVWSYNRFMDDIDTHGPFTVPCGFVYSPTTLFRKLDDGRLMMTVEALIWKKYSGQLMSLFERDNAKKSVSVEIEVFEVNEFPNGGGEILDFQYAAICILGDHITPAIPNAKAEVIKFAKEYKQAFDKEFSSKYDDVDFTIPKKVKTNAQKGLDLFKQHGRGGNSVALASARFLIKNSIATPQKIRNIAKYFASHSLESFEENDPPSNSYITYFLWGGSESRKWSQNINSCLDDIDKQRMSYFEDSSNIGGENNNDMEVCSMKNAEEKDELKDKEEFETKPENEEEEGTQPEEKEEKEEKFESEQKPKEKPEDEESENEEDKEGDKEGFAEEEGEEEETQEEANKEEEMSFLSTDMLASLAGAEGQMKDVACELAKPESERNYAVIVNGMFSYIQEMSAKIEQTSSENVALKEFKANVEKEKFDIEVNATLLECATVMPKSEIDALREDAQKNHTLDTLEAWRNKAKAKAFSFSQDVKKGDGITRYANPFTESTKKSDSLW